LGELNLTDELRLGPLRILGIGPRHGDEGRGVAADALERRHYRAAELDAVHGPDTARTLPNSPKVVVALANGSIGSRFQKYKQYQIVTLHYSLWFCEKLKAI